MGIKGFISYAHEDQELSQQFKDGITAHSRLLKDIRWDVWGDKNIKVGQKWHEAIQKSIAECAFAILLISAAFFDSKYIEENELRRFLEKYRNDDTFLIFPVLIRPCHFDQAPGLSEIQHFVPDGNKYGQPGKKNLAFSYLIGKPEVDDYFMDCVDALEKSLQKVLAAREQKKAAAAAAAAAATVVSAGNESFDIIPCTGLTAKDVFNLGRAKSVRENLYWKRPRVDDTINELLDKGENIIILGNPLAGKTRAFYEAVKNRTGWWLIKPKRGVGGRDLVLPPLPNGPKIAFFDDIHGYAGKDDKKLETVLEQLMAAEIPIIAACRKGPEYLAFRAGTQDLELDFREVVIKKMSVDEERNFLQMSGVGDGNLDKEAFRRDHDKNIGSFFMDITGMRQRYEALRDKIVPEYKRHNKYAGPARLPETILEGIAYFYYAGRYTAGEGYSIDDIKDFCARKFDYDHRQVGKGPERSGRGVKSSLSTGLEKLGMTVGDKDNAFTNLNFDEALDILSDTARHDLSFIDVQQPWIFMEAVYIEKIVRVRGDVGEIIGNLKKYYKWEEIKSRFLTDVYQFSHFIRSARDLAQGMKVLEQMQELGVPPNVVTFNSLLPLCKELEQGFAIIDKMQGAGIQPNVVTFTSLLPLCHELGQGFTILDKMQGVGIQPDVVTFNSLLPLCHELEQGFAIINKMQGARIQPNVVTFNSLLRFCNTLEQGFALMDKMEKAKIRPNIVTFSSLLKLTRDKAGLDRVETARMKNNIREDNFYKDQLSKVIKRYL